MCLPAWKHLDLTQCCWGLWRLPQVGMIGYELHSQPRSPLWRMGVALKRPASKHPSIFLRTSPDPGAHPELPYQDKRCFQCSDHGGIDKGSGPGTGARDRCTYVFHIHAPDRRVQSLHLYLCCSPPSTPTSRLSAPLLLFHFHDHRDVPRFP